MIKLVWIFFIVVSVPATFSSPYNLKAEDFPSSQECPNKNNSGKPNSFLWILNRDPPSYFFGTIHVPYTRVWNYIPKSTKDAFVQAENIVFELDLTDVYTISALANCQLLPKGENLSDVLPPDLYNRLKRHLDYVRQKMPMWMSADQKGKGIYADYLFNAIAGNWERKRPIWVMLLVNSLTESDIKSRGTPVLDLFLAQEAEKIGKITGAIEKVEEQCVPLNELNFSQVLFALNQTLLQHEIYRNEKDTVRYTTDQLIDHYNCGDLNAIILNKNSAQVPSLANDSLPPEAMEMAKFIDDYFRFELIIKRNQRMAERVINLLKANPTKSFFFAFGAGHFLGNDTILDRLWEEGYEVEHIPAEESISKFKDGNKNRKRKKGKNSSLPLFDSFSEFWLQMDSDTDYKEWIEKREKHRKKIYNKYKETNFNDLWVRIDPKSQLLHHVSQNDQDSDNTGDFFANSQPLEDYDHYSPHNSASCHGNMLMLWTLVMLLIFVIMKKIHS